MTTRANDKWTSRFGLVMAMAGGAVGLGNFLRLPGKMEPYGGTFLVPYFIALILLGIPLMWIEWTIGRHGGGHGHGSTPGMFHRLWSHPISKYLGIFGVFLPFLIGIYYVYIESWCLGYAWMSITGQYWGHENVAEMGEVFNEYLGTSGNATISFGPQAYTFFVITFLLNLLVFGRGVRRGIEIVAKIAMPVLIVFAFALVIRVITLPAVDGRNFFTGLSHLLRVDWPQLATPGIWLTATGQIFFTLSLGFGMIHTYASYLSKDDDVTQASLYTCGLNEFIELVFGMAIAVPAAVIFFGTVQTSEIVAGGTFNIGFFALPVIFQQMPGELFGIASGQVFGAMWFFLLFLAAITSSVAMFTPLLLFMNEELRIDRNKSLAFIAVTIAILMQPVVLLMNFGVLDELDFWAGTYFLVMFAAIEAVVFAWIFGMDKGWEEMHQGAQFQVPRFFYPIMKYITPIYILALLVWWTIENLVLKYDTLLLLEGASPEKKMFIWMTRGIIIGCFIAMCAGVHYAWKKYHYIYPADFEGDRG